MWSMSTMRRARSVGARLVNAVGDLPVGTAIDYEGVGTIPSPRTTAWTRRT